MLFFKTCGWLIISADSHVKWKKHCRRLKSQDPHRVELPSELIPSGSIYNTCQLA